MPRHRAVNLRHLQLCHVIRTGAAPRNLLEPRYLWLRRILIPQEPPAYHFLGYRVPPTAAINSFSYVTARLAVRRQSSVRGLGAPL